MSNPTDDKEYQEYLEKIKSSSFPVSSIPEKYQTEALFIKAIQVHPFRLNDLPEHLKQNQAIYTAAVNDCGSALRKVPADVITEAMCLSAVTEAGWFLADVPRHMMTVAVCIAAINHSKESLEYVRLPADDLLSNDQQLKAWINVLSHVKEMDHFVINTLNDVLILPLISQIQDRPAEQRISKPVVNAIRSVFETVTSYKLYGFNEEQEVETQQRFKALTDNFGAIKHLLDEVRAGRDSSLEM